METEFRKIKTLASYAAHARFLAECDDEPIGWIVNRGLPKEPYQYSPTKQILRHHVPNGTQAIFICETGRRRYKVFLLLGAQLYKSDDDATKAFSEEVR